MNQIKITIATLLFSATSFALAPAFAGGGEGDGGMGHEGDKSHECMHKGMEAAKLSEEQHGQAHEFMKGMMETKKAHEPAIHEGMHAMMMAWEKHPISKDEVIAAESAIAPHMTAVKTAMRDGMIGFLNVMSADQRKAYETEFMTCMKPAK